MPQIVPAVIAAISYVGASATAVVAGTATFAQIATVAAVGIGAGIASNVAMKALSPQIGSSGSSIEWTADPDAPMHFAFGRIGVAGNIIHSAVYGPDQMYAGFVCELGSAGPIKSFVSFRADDNYLTFGSGGQCLVEPYTGEMWVSRTLGAQPDTALPRPSGLKNGAAMPGWDSSSKMSGTYGYIVTMGENSKGSAFNRKVPKFLNVIEGLYCYDPRLDSTYPGGSGSCRLNNPATWVWTQNPILFALKWSLGLWEGPTGKGAPQVDYQVGGIGAKIEGIHVASFVSAANINDANGWQGAAWPSTDDDKAQVLNAFMKAGGSVYAEIAGKIACVHRAAPRASVFTVTARDTAGPVEIDTASSKLNRINTIRPKFWSEANDWQMTALDEVTAEAWQIEDGQGVAVKRTRGVDYDFVPLPKQARELASLEISNSREGIKGRAPLRPYMDPEPGDCFVFDEPDFLLSNLKCIVLNVEDDTENDSVVVTFETETDAKYPYAYGQSNTPPASPGLTPSDPTLVNPPLPGDWTVTVRPPATGGTQLPGFDLTGLVSNDMATAILVEYGPSATGPWTQAYQGPPTVTNVPIDGLQPGQTYYVAVSYQRGQNYSARQVYGPYTAPSLVADDISPTGAAWDRIRDDIDAALADFDPAGAIGDQLNALEADIAALDTGLDGLQTLTATHTTQIADRVTNSMLNAQITRIDGAETINASQQTTLVDLEANKAEQTDLDFLSARTTTTEADIIDLEIAQASETTARAQAIQQVTARQTIRPNLDRNSSGISGVTGWSHTGSLITETNSFGGPRLLFNGSSGTQVATQTEHFLASPGAFYTISGDPLYFAASGGIYSDIQWEKSDGSLSSVAPFSPRIGGAATLNFPGRMELTVQAPSDAARGRKRIFVESGVSVTAAGWRQLKTEAGAGPATLWTDDANQVSLSANVTENALAVIDLETQNALAAYEVEALATGGLPAFLKLYSSTLGGYAALAAPIVALLNTVSGGAPLVALEARDGEVYFPRAIYVALPGTSFHAIIGPRGTTSTGTLIWFGPDTINAATATRNNCVFALGTDGQPYLGGSVLGQQPVVKRLAGQSITTSGSVALDFPAVASGGVWEFSIAARAATTQVAPGSTGDWTIYEQSTSDSGATGTILASGHYSTDGSEPTIFDFDSDKTGTVVTTGARRVRFILSNPSDSGNVTAGLTAKYYPPA